MVVSRNGICGGSALAERTGRTKTFHAREAIEEYIDDLEDLYLAQGAGQLDPQAARAILKFLDEKVARASDPRRAGRALVGSALGNFWRYRVGDLRVFADIQDQTVTVG